MYADNATKAQQGAGQQEVDEEQQVDGELEQESEATESDENDNEINSE